MAKNPLSLCRIYETRSDASVLASKLRGAAVFKVLREDPSYGLKVYEMTEDGKVPTPKRGIALVDLQVLEVARSWTAELLAADELSLIVDVHFPMHDPTLAVALQPGRGGRARDRELDRTTREYWFNKKRLDWCKGILEAADAVVTPHGAWTWGMHDYSNTVVTLPDVVDPASGAKFYRYLMELIQEVRKPKSEPSIWARLLKPILRPASGWATENMMLKDLENRNIDWSYSEVPDDPQ